jgi:hypothetical protein
MSAPAKATGGGGARNPNSLANLRPGAGAGDGGLQRNLGHGAYAAIAKIEMDAAVKRVYDAVAADAPVRSEGELPRQDTIVVRQLAEALVRRERIRESELRHGIEAADGKLRGVVEYGLRLDNQITKLAIELGMTPRSRAALGVDITRVASTMADEVAAGQAAREARERELTTVDGTATDVSDEA